MLAGIAFFLFLFFIFFSAPVNFPIGTFFTIEQGESLREVSLNLKEKHIIRSRTAFEALVILYGGERRIMYSDYFFDMRLSVFEVARRIARGERNITQLKVTIPEGLNNSEIAEILVEKKLVRFNKNKFLQDAATKEGYLFPDTYFFLITDGEGEVLKSMSENFEKKMASIGSQIFASDKIEKDIVTMASILEKEAKGDSDRRIISGILWNRLSISMPLQVDAAMQTYKERGLPKSPIGNPGMEALLAAINPQKSSYLYYLHDKSGNVHYAKTFSEHLQNKSKYLH